MFLQVAPLYISNNFKTSLLLDEDHRKIDFTLILHICFLIQGNSWWMSTDARVYSYQRTSGTEQKNVIYCKLEADFQTL